jgi:hypothetical protein
MNVDLVDYLLDAMRFQLAEIDTSSLQRLEAMLQMNLGLVWAEQAKRANQQSEEASNG